MTTRPATPPTTPPTTTGVAGPGPELDELLPLPALPEGEPLPDPVGDPAPPAPTAPETLDVEVEIDDVDVRPLPEVDVLVELRNADSDVPVKEAVEMEELLEDVGIAEVMFGADVGKLAVPLDETPVPLLLELLDVGTDRIADPVKE